MRPIDSLACLVTYLPVLFSFCDQFLLRIGFIEWQETILCAGELVWSFSLASDADELSLIPYAELPAFTVCQ